MGNKPPSVHQLIFFVYPDPKGSEENQFTPPGDGVNKLIFERFEIRYQLSLPDLNILKSEIKHLTSEKKKETRRIFQFILISRI
jgi:hypothetical protein